MPLNAQDFLNSTSSFPLPKNVLLSVTCIHLALAYALVFWQTHGIPKTHTKLLVHTLSLKQEHIVETPPPAATVTSSVTASLPAKKPPTPTKLKKTSAKPRPQRPVAKKKEEPSFTEVLASLDKVRALAAEKEALRRSVQKTTAPKMSTLPNDASPAGEALTMAEELYVAELVRRLKAAMRLPEFGEVKVRLCVTKSGAVKQLQILSAKSQKNRAYVEKMLPTMQFAAFGKQFTGEQEHTFLLTLSNESFA